jgi:hypothetical protein
MNQTNTFTKNSVTINIIIAPIMKWKENKTHQLPETREHHTQNFVELTMIQIRVPQKDATR